MALCFALAGCAKKDHGDATPNPAGTYSLASVDGQAVPCKVSHEGHEMEVKSGRFVIEPGGTCSSETTFAVSGHADVVREVKANYTQDGTTLTMKWEGAGTTTGKIEEGTFTMNNEGMIFVYRK